jgi:hypothetical protein
VVISQVGLPLPIGAKSAVYRKEFGSFANLRGFVEAGGQKGVQRPVLPPGSLVPIHPVGFLVITRAQVYGLPASPEVRAKTGRGGELTPSSLGLKAEQLELLRIEPQPRGKDAGPIDMVGIVTTYEGDPLPSGDIAIRLGGFTDIEQLEKKDVTDGSPHRSAARQQKQSAQQLPGLPGLPRARRQDRPAARPAPVRRVPAEPVPRAGRDGADARGEPG